jgi:hypothetical protein
MKGSSSQKKSSYSLLGPLWSQKKSSCSVPRLAPGQFAIGCKRRAQRLRKTSTELPIFSFYCRRFPDIK